MAKSKKKIARDKTGPFLTAAMIAEKILTESDNVPTIVRVVDQVGIPPEAIKDRKNEGIAIPLTIWVSFRTGGFKGKSLMSLVQVSPSGATEPLGVSEITFDGKPATAFNIKAPIVLKWEGEGLYWYDVFLDDKPCTRIALTVTVAAGVSTKKEQRP